MNLGVFDSGLGGLLIAKSIRTHLPDIDMIYYGDTLHLPYGNRSAEAIYEYSRRAMEYLFSQDCRLIIVACNTVSATALRRLQQEYLPSSPWPERRIIGVVVPTLEEAIEKGHKNIGLLGTHHTVNSNVYSQELQKLNPDIQIVQNAAPLLVPMIENDGIRWIDPVLKHYLAPLIESGSECLILGCTHYSLLKDKITTLAGKNMTLLSQDEIIPRKLASYLDRHPEIANDIGRSGKSRFLVSDLTQNYKESAISLYGQHIEIEKTTSGEIL
ncbi:MAG: glutamate racemase [Alphaproteobacteria bacterium]|jgi:glutamate racemase|nr:glutamate racemase [Alphaproteobacteria bacterium]QQS56339.1 MAG: glutamate racemase [Alphaproteobacteria bacterium]